MRAFLKARVSPLIPHRHFWPRRTGERERPIISRVRRTYPYETCFLPAQTSRDIGLFFSLALSFS